MRLHPLTTTLLSALLTVVLATGCSSAADDSTGPSGSADHTPTPKSAAAAAQGPDFPAIDETTLIVDTIHPAIDPDSLSIPPRRFYSRESALRYMEDSEEAQLYNAGILPRMLGEWLPYADRLLNSVSPTFIVVDKQSMHVAVFDRLGRMVRSFPMACAHNYGTKHRRSDSRTPEGFFIVQGVYDSSEWPGTGLGVENTDSTHTPLSAYGPRFIRVRTDANASIGIHGTPDASIVGTRSTRGSIQLANDDIMELSLLAVPGTPVIINPGDRDAAVNRAEGYDIPQISIGLAVALTGRNLASDLRRSYPARPANIDTSLMEPHALPDSLVIAPEDTIELIDPELLPLTETLDSLTRRP